ncbi:MAG: RHS repeat-associated core domain-containing protein [Rhodopirellula bahusiensis]
MSASEDPLGNVTHIERKTVPENGDDKLTRDRGEITTVRGPDPDRYFNGAIFVDGTLDRPTTEYSYEGDTPFVNRTTLPTLAGDPRTYITSTTAYIHGQPTRIEDELGNLTVIDRDTLGIAQSSYRFVDGSPDQLTWQNSVDRFDVTNEDGQHVSSLDALRIINELNNQQFSSSSGTLIQPRPANATDFFDVSGDGIVSALDALQVINRLNNGKAAGLKSGQKIEQTDYIYVGSQAYQDLINDPGNYIGSNNNAIHSAFTANDLLGAEIIQTGREDATSGSFIRIYLYHLDNPASTLHGQLKEVIETELDPTDINPSTGNPRPNLTEEIVARTRYTYDTNGHLSSITDPENRVTNFTNDEFGRPTKILSPNPGDVEIDGIAVTLSRPETNIQYDAFGNVFQVEDVADVFASTQLTDSNSEIYYVPEIQSQKRLTTYRYDSENRLVAIVGPDPDVNLDASLEQPETVDDPRLGLGSIENFDTRPVTLFIYDEFGQVQETSTFLQDGTTTSSQIASTTFAYDRLGRPIQKANPETVVAAAGTSISIERPVYTYEYYADGKLRSETDPSGLKMSMDYDIWSRPVEEITARGSTELRRTSTDYRSVNHSPDKARGVAGNQGWSVVSTTTQPGTPNELLQAVETTYDQDGQTKAVRMMLEDSGQVGVFDESDLASVYRYDYFADGQIAVATDPRKFETTYEYDHLRRMSAVTRPEAIFIPESGAVLGEYSNVSTTSYEYDLANQLTNITDGTGRETNYTYDGLGNPDVVTLEEGGFVAQKTDYDYNGFSELNRWIANPDEYSEPGATTTINSRSHFTIGMSYHDRLGQQVINQSGFYEQTTLDYDRGGRLSSLTDASGNTTQWGYDSAGRTQSDSVMIDTAGGLQAATRQYVYDAVGNLKRKTDRNGRLTSYSYDDLHQPENERWFDSSAAFGDNNDSGGLDFEYDSIGRLIEAGDQAAVGANYSHQYEFAYDVGGRVRSELQDLRGSTGRINVGWSREYDESSNLVSVTGYTVASLNADGNVTGLVDHHDAISRDSHNRVTEISRKIGFEADTASGSDLHSQQIQFRYDKEGRTRFIERDHVASGTSYGLNTLISYDKAGRTSEIDHQSERPSNPFSGNYETIYNAAGLLTLSRVNLVSLIADTALQQNQGGLTREFAYDVRGQLQEEGIGSGGNSSTTYSYDESGNRVAYEQNAAASSSPITDSSVDADNRLRQDQDSLYKYDNEGNLIRKGYVPGHPSDNISWEYEWDNRNRLVQARQYDNATLQKTIDYSYDAMNKLIRRAEAGSVETLAHDGEEVGLHFINSQLETRYLWQEGVDQLLAEQDTGSNSIAWTLTDHLGSVRDRVRANGDHIQHHDYDAFGREQYVSNSSGVTGNTDLLFGYTGKMRDEDTDLQSNQNRWYDSANGRWLSQDPIGLEPDSNPYRYVRNQPTTLTDPSGLEPPSMPFVIPPSSPGMGQAIAAERARQQLPKYKVVTGSIADAIRYEYFSRCMTDGPKLTQWNDNSQVIRMLDDGSVRSASLATRRDFMINYAIFKGVPADGNYHLVVIPRWTNVFSFADRFHLAGGNLSFWLNGPTGFHAAGSYEIKFDPNSNHTVSKTVKASFRNAAVNWRLTDYVDANNGLEYDWSSRYLGFNLTNLMGCFEVTVGDMLGDRILGGSYGIEIYSNETTNGPLGIIRKDE